MRFNLTTTCILALGLVLTSCSFLENSGNGRTGASSEGSAVPSGSQVIARAIPKHRAFTPPSSYAFAPGVQASRSGTWLRINRAERKIQVMNGDNVVQSVDGEGVDRLSAGAFSILHKQRDPAWYAPESYFLRRKLSVPAEGDRSRYRRGALGAFAIFLGKDLPIHSGPVWSEEVGGVRLQNDDISRLYYALELGTPVEIE